MKNCKHCDIEKPLTEFFKDKNTRDGYRSQCKVCKQIQTELWRQKNREKYNLAQKEYHSKHYRRLHLQRYKLTLEQYNKMIKTQRGRCAICNTVPKTIRPLAIDHDHNTGRTRALLCYKCNRDMNVIDNDAQLQACLSYKNKHN